MKRFTTSEITDLIQKEIDWSNANKGDVITDKASFWWHDGYIQGLKQAALLVRQFDEVLKDACDAC